MDNKFKEYLENYSVEPPADMWSRIENELDGGVQANQGNLAIFIRKYSYYAAAAIVICVLGISFVVMNNTSDGVQPVAGDVEGKSLITFDYENHDRLSPEYDLDMEEAPIEMVAENPIESTPDNDEMIEENPSWNAKKIEDEDVDLVEYELIAPVGDDTDLDMDENPEDIEE